MVEVALAGLGVADQVVEAAAGRPPVVEVVAGGGAADREVAVVVAIHIAGHEDRGVVGVVVHDALTPFFLSCLP